jgi:hypothetical protein
MESNKEINEKYLSNNVSYADIMTEFGADNSVAGTISSRERILGRLEGFVRGGLVVSNNDLKKILEEQEFSSQEISALSSALSCGIRKGLDLKYNAVEDFWEAYAERLRNVVVIFEYKQGRD